MTARARSGSSAAARLISVVVAAAMAGVTLSALIGPAFPARPAGAAVDPDPPSSGSTDAGVDGRDIRVRARVRGGRYRSTGCRYRPVQPTDLVVIDGLSHHPYGRSCPGRVSDVVLVPVTPVPVELLLPDAVDEAVARLPVPSPILLGRRPDGWLVVGLAVDLRLDPSELEPVVVTASVEGPTPTWITVTASPSELRFHPGDPGDPSNPDGAACPIPTVVAPFRPDRPGICSFTYRNASSTVVGDTFRAAATVVWSIRFESSTGSGTLAPVSVEGEIPVRVAEIQALVECDRNCVDAEIFWRRR